MKTFREYLAEAKLNEKEVVNKIINERQNDIERMNGCLLDYLSNWMIDNGYDIENNDVDFANNEYHRGQKDLTEKDVFELFKSYMKDNGHELLKFMKKK